MYYYYYYYLKLIINNIILLFFSKDVSQLNGVITQAFAFCYIWSIGGNLTENYWESFDSFVRRQLEDHPEAKVSMKWTNKYVYFL